MQPPDRDSAAVDGLAAVGIQPGADRVHVTGHRGGERFSADDWVADEVPVALEYNGISHAVMLATPLDLEDFALGFSLSEGILATPVELFDVEVAHHASVGGGGPGTTLSLTIAAGAFARLKDRRRSMAGRTGCGLCGTENLAQVYRTLQPIVPLPANDPRAAASISRQAIAGALTAAANRQQLQRLTGAVHAATWTSVADPSSLLQREDVGRHNALDKLIGALAARTAHRRGTEGVSEPADRGFIAVTSRASLEMVQKAVMARVPLLAAVSAPTALAIRVADAAGLTLVGFARGDDLVAYAHPERIDWR